MKPTARRSYVYHVRLTVRVMSLLVLTSLCLAGFAGPVQAVGSSNVSGSRPYIEWHATATSGDILRQTTIEAYANAGEQILIGSSAIGVGLSGDVRFYGPAGATGSCRAQGIGMIADRAQELAGPLPAAGGFTPCVISAAQTAAAGNGIWDFEFISPNPNSDIMNTNPPTQLVTAAWTQSTTGHWTNAWYVSVRNAGADVPGRVFAKYLAYNMGGNGVGLNTQYWIATSDGYVYQVDMNGIDPFGFIFFANAEGITDARGNSIYRSLQLVSSATGFALPRGYSLYNPGLPDAPAQRDITHKIFFEPPSSDLPPVANSRSGTTWLQPLTVAPPIPSNFTFTGVEGTSGQAGTAPLGGNFAFDIAGDADYQITIIANGTPVRTLVGRAFTGHNTVYWDALDGAGVAVPAGPQLFNAQIQTSVGEVHFPFIDAENNPSGIQLSRFLGGPANPVKDLVYYNDTFTYTSANTYDYSPCASGDTPTPPAGLYPLGGPNSPKDALCYGIPPAQRTALSGIHSAGGSHQWSASYGDQRVIDTWTYFFSDPVSLSGAFILAQADLAITKTHSPPQLIPGQPVTYTIQVTNGSDPANPSAVVGAQVTDSVPAQILNPTWTCAITQGTGACRDVSGSGNLINTRVNLNPNAVATYTIQGVVDPSATGSLTNDATVRRPNDNTDPNLANNAAHDIAPVLTTADLELNKTVSTVPPILPNSLVDFAIDLRNRGPMRATGVAVSEQLPAGLTFISFRTAKGSYSAASGIWSVGAMAPGEVATLMVRARWDGSAVTNTAQVSTSDLRDPDSTPGGGPVGEDDQASATLPLQVADLTLVKRGSAPRVNVGAHVVFSIDVANRGPDGATGVRVSDQLPVGLALVRATPSQGTYDSVRGSWVVGSLANGATSSLQIEAIVLGTGPFTNTAQISGSDQGDPNSTPNNDKPGEDDQGFATVSGDLADLSLSKGVDNPQPLFGRTITYTLTLQNAGPSAATGVAVADRLPAGLTFVSATPDLGIYDATSGIWAVGSLPASSSVRLIIRATVASGALIRNTAQVSASDQPDPDSTPGDDDPASDDQASIALIPQISDLSLKKTVDILTPSVGDVVTFTVAVTNAGPSVATGVEVTEQLPVGLQYESHATLTGAYNPATGIWTLGGMRVGEVATLAVRARVTGVGPYTNTAEIRRSDQPDLDSTPGNGIASEDDQGSVTLGGTLADLALTKRVDSIALPLHHTVNYTIEVLNSGPSAATGVTVAEYLPTGTVVLTSTPSGGSYDLPSATWTVGRLAIGERASLTLAVQLNGNGPFLNTAEISRSDQLDPDSTPGNAVVGEDDQASATVGLGLAPQLADLELTKTVTALGKLLNGAVFLITVVNRGPDAATNVEVSDLLPAGLVFVGAAPSQGSYNLATGTWAIGSIPSGAAVTLQITALVSTNDNITNTAQVSRSDQPDPDSTPGNSVTGEDDQASITFNRLTAVTLTGLSADWQTKGVLLRWATGSELNSLGFQIYRSASGSRADAVRVTPQLILSRGSAVGGASYSFLDSSALGGANYSYWLIERQVGGGSSELGPVRPAKLSNGQNPVYLPIIWR